ncbi:hypothetical protein TNCV_4653721 [Trichonephila clavipes]|nr:hypothetical protein TNCV_4653721 [Trichonephila clavipes]
MPLILSMSPVKPIKNSFISPILLVPRKAHQDGFLHTTNVRGTDCLQEELISCLTRCSNGRAHHHLLREMISFNPFGIESKCPTPPAQGSAS